MSLQLIGAGFGRTGTASVKVALEMLGLAPCYHMSEVLKDMSRIDHWLRAADGQPDWDLTFDGFLAAVDFPTSAYYAELAAHFPDANVLLTVRDAGKWFDSVHETIMSPAMREMIAGTPFGELNQRIIWDRFDNRVDDREHMIQCFNEHTEAVRRTIPAARLLIYEVKDGWEPLCAFLDKPVPDEDFPRINSREETKALLKALANEDGKGVNQQNAADAARSLHAG